MKEAGENSRKMVERQGRLVQEGIEEEMNRLSKVQGLG